MSESNREQAGGFMVSVLNIQNGREDKKQILCLEKVESRDR
jgi:hypothetical protein